MGSAIGGCSISFPGQAPDAVHCAGVLGADPVSLRGGARVHPCGGMWVTGLPWAVSVTP